MNTGDSLKDFGNRMALMRQKRGMSQAELAKKLGKSQSLIAAYEIGRVKSLPDDDMINTLASVLDTKAESLLGANELVLDRFDPAIAQWIMSEESTSYIKEAFLKWATDKANAR